MSSIIPTNPTSGDESLLQELEADKVLLATLIAQAFLEQQIEGYAHFTTAELSQQIVPTLAIMFQFFRDGNTSPPKANIIKWAQIRVKAGFSVESLEKAVNILVSIIEAHINKLLAARSDSTTMATPGTPLAKLQAKYKRRLENLQALCQVNAINSALN
jgi:hypothetical protein